MAKKIVEVDEDLLKGMMTSDIPPVWKGYGTEGN